MGAGGSRTQRLDKALVSAQLPEGERFFGLENFGNTCYCNSVLQALYYCLPFREKCLEHAAASATNGDDDLLSCLCELFRSISSQRKRCGVHAPKKFVAKLRDVNELFNNSMHQVGRLAQLPCDRAPAQWTGRARRHAVLAPQAKKPTPSMSTALPRRLRTRTSS